MLVELSMVVGCDVQSEHSIVPSRRAVVEVCSPLQPSIEKKNT
jgi:hypothetical protein